MFLFYFSFHPDPSSCPHVWSNEQNILKEGMAKQNLWRSFSQKHPEGKGPCHLTPASVRLNLNQLWPSPLHLQPPTTISTDRSLSLHAGYSSAALAADKLCFSISAQNQIQQSDSCFSGDGRRRRRSVKERGQPATVLHRIQPQWERRVRERGGREWERQGEQYRERTRCSAGGSQLSVEEEGSQAAVKL